MCALMKKFRNVVGYAEEVTFSFGIPLFNSVYRGYIGVYRGYSADVADFFDDKKKVNGMKFFLVLTLYSLSY